MATTTAPGKVPHVQPDDDLSDEQIDELLARATNRLREKSKSKDLVQTGESHTYAYTFPKLDTGKLEKPYVSTEGNIATADAPRLLEDKQRKQANGIRKVEDPVAAKELAIEKKKSTAGPSWYNLPRTDLTPALKRDLQLIKMRNVLDPHRHYKKENGKMQAPEYSQVGTIIEGPTEFFSGRIEKSKRKRTFAEEVLAGEQETKRFRRKYGELQGRKTSGKKGFYKGVMAKRRTGGLRKGG